MSVFGHMPSQAWNRDLRRAGTLGSGLGTVSREAGPGVRLQGRRTRPEADQAHQGPLRAPLSQGDPSGDCQGPQGLATGPRVSPAGGHEGARDVTSADQAHAPTRLRGGNALSHSYERSSLLEGRGKPRITPSHSWMPRLQGRGGWSPEPTHQDTTHLDTLSREKASGSPHPHKSTSRPHLAMGLISWP